LSGSYWLDADPAPSFSSRGGAGRVDVAIVGAGVTGCAAALRLARSGVRVRVHEARFVAAGASGRNGGFALRGGAMRYDLAREAYGADAARELWRWTEDAVDRFVELGGDTVRRVGSLRLAADEAEREAIRLEYEALRADGFAAQWIDRPLEPFRAAIVHPQDAAFDPARFTRRLAAAAAAAGAEIVEGSRVASVEELDAERVLVATDGLGGGLLPELDAVVHPARNQVLVTEPHGEERFPRPHYARHGHAYWQQLPNGRVVLGGFRDADPETEATGEHAGNPVVEEALDGFLRETLRVDAPVAERWSGVFGLTADMLPLVGELRPAVWASAGYSGHGNVMGVACGQAVADALLGRAVPDALQLFDPRRPR
jgi:glycine/D-amino acid oxidase-like deaminating enzyme